MLGVIWDGWCQKTWRPELIPGWVQSGVSEQCLVECVMKTILWMLAYSPNQLAAQVEVALFEQDTSLVCRWEHSIFRVVSSTATSQCSFLVVLPILILWPKMAQVPLLLHLILHDLLGLMFLCNCLCACIWICTKSFKMTVTSVGAKHFLFLMGHIWRATYAELMQSSEKYVILMDSSSWYFKKNCDLLRILIFSICFESLKGVGSKSLTVILYFPRFFFFHFSPFSCQVRIRSKPYYFVD